MFDHYKMKMFLLHQEKKKRKKGGEQQNVRRSCQTQPSAVHLRHPELREGWGGVSTPRGFRAPPLGQEPFSWVSTG